jgi:hypothetical protein
MNIFTKIKNAIYGPKYYSEVIAKPFSYSFKYLLVFALLFGLAFTIVATIKFVPMVNLMSQKAPELANYFPQGLVITIKDGKVSTNVQEPYFIKLPPNYNNKNNNQSGKTEIENLIVIDTKDKFDIDTFNSYKAAMLLTEDSIVYLDSNNKISISSLSGLNNFKLDKGQVVSLINMVKPFLVILYPVVFVGAYIGGFFVVVGKMVYLLFGALLVWLVAKAKGIKMGYKKSYRAGMQLMTAAIIITSVLGAISPKFTFPFLFSILLIISAAINLRKEAVQPVAAAPIA